MKRIFVLMMAFSLLMVMKAEDVIQIKPFEAKAGTTTWTPIDVELVNSKSFTAFQFDVFVPEGITFSTSVSSKYMSNRFLHYDEEEDDDMITHSIEVTDKGPDEILGHHYFVTCYDNNFAMISGTVGTLFNFRYKTSADMQPGVYPIYVTGAKLAVDGNPENGAKPANSVSFVKITDAEGNVPENSCLDLEDYMIPSFVQSELPEQNVIVNGECSNLVLSDKTDFSVSAPFTAAKASYSRQMTNQWGTIVLPYEVTSDDNVKYYIPSSVDGGTLNLTYQDVLPANTPALVAKVSGDGISANASNVVVNSALDSSVNGNVTMHGSYTNNTKVTDANAYYIKDNKFWLNNDHFFVDAFRAYFTVTGASQARSLNISRDGATVISALVGNSEVGISEYYDASGARSNNLRKGVNIVRLSNGETKKIIVE